MTLVYNPNLAKVKVGPHANIKVIDQWLESIHRPMDKLLPNLLKPCYTVNNNVKL